MPQAVKPLCNFVSVWGEVSTKDCKVMEVKWKASTAMLTSMESRQC